MSQFHRGTRSISQRLFPHHNHNHRHRHHQHQHPYQNYEHHHHAVRIFWLVFAVPRTEILGEPDRYVKAGSNVVLRCIVRGALEPPTFIMWYHGAEQLAADSRRHRTQLDPNLPEANGEGQSTVSLFNCSLVDFNLITLDFKLRIVVRAPRSVCCILSAFVYSAYYV